MFNKLFLAESEDNELDNSTSETGVDYIYVDEETGNQYRYDMSQGKLVPVESDSNSDSSDGSDEEPSEGTGEQSQEDSQESAESSDNSSDGSDASDNDKSNDSAEPHDSENDTPSKDRTPNEEPQEMGKRQSKGAVGDDEVTDDDLQLKADRKNSWGDFEVEYGQFIDANTFNDMKGHPILEK